MKKELSLVELTELATGVDEATALRRIRNRVLDTVSIRYVIPPSEDGSWWFHRLGDGEYVKAQFSVVVLTCLEDEIEDMQAAFEKLNPFLRRMTKI